MTPPAAAWGWLRERAAREAEDEALVDGARRLTFADLEAEAAAVAARLAAAGVAAGDRIGLACENSAAFVAAYLGMLGCGAVASP